MSVTVYTFEDADGTEDSYTTTNAHEAQARGATYGLRVIAHQYEWADSEVAWDFTDPETPSARVRRETKELFR